jgi:hypothetical protein
MAQPSTEQPGEGPRPDPRGVPFLANVVKTDSDPYVIDLAIGALGAKKCRAAIKALIDCFEAPLVAVGRQQGRRPAVTPASIEPGFGDTAGTGDTLTTH